MRALTFDWLFCVHGQNKSCRYTFNSLVYLYCLATARNAAAVDYSPVSEEFTGQGAWNQQTGCALQSPPQKGNMIYYCGNKHYKKKKDKKRSKMQQAVTFTTLRFFHPLFTRWQTWALGLEIAICFPQSPLWIVSDWNWCLSVVWERVM